MEQAQTLTVGVPATNVDSVPLNAKEEPRTTWRTYTNPELIQPTIIAISATYIIYAIGALYNLTPNLPAETQFSYYVASLSLITSLLFYARFISSSSSYVSFMELAYIASSSIVIAVYIMYWFITPNFSKLTHSASLSYQNQNVQENPYFYQGDDEDDHDDEVTHFQDLSQKPKLNFSKCIDTRKCSHPVHLVLQSAFMICIVVSLIFSIIRRG